MEKKKPTTKKNKKKERQEKKNLDYKLAKDIWVLNAGATCISLPNFSSSEFLHKLPLYNIITTTHQLLWQTGSLVKVKHYL